MALIRDFELPSTGLTAPNAYHVVKKVTTEKRLNDVPPPPDPSRPDELTERPAEDSEVYWRAGYVGKISIEVFVSREARDAGREPIGAITVNPTDVEFNGVLSSDIRNFDLHFFIDASSQESIISQAYTHLKSLVYYENATEG
nr:hypothetical protein [uncultured Mediterranean phage uvMED]|tara:strand:- start:3742 stop:4170 length:429 start_codon:yes stop_codon:yes gene_type:complete